MNTFCFLFIFAFEQFVSYVFFSNKYRMTKSRRFIICCYFCSFALQYLINLTNLPIVNILSFFICNAVVVFICFQSTFRQNIFSVLLIEAIMIATELAIMYTVSIFLDVPMTEYADNDAVIFFETAATKSLYFFVVYIFSKISIKEKNSNGSMDFSLTLFVLPLSSVFTFLCFMYLTIKLSLNREIYLVFMVTSLILLFSNTVVFYIHEKVVSTLVENSEYQLERQKAEINREYYSELEKQYNVSNILIHDIKKHLEVIRSYASDGNTESINSYIDSVYDSTELHTLKQFSKNKLVNVIINRYAHLCDLAGITLNTDIRNVEVSFMADGDMTSLLDNMLENAFEAAKVTTEKRIDISMENKNESYILIKTKNSCFEEPKSKNGILVSTKSEKGRHGIGMKSIKRIVQKYNGNVEYSFNNNEMTFSVSALVKNS